MDKYLQAIGDFSGAEELYGLLSRWDRLSERNRSGEIKEFVSGAIYDVFPDMFWVAPPGGGKTELLHLMAGHLEAADEFVFEGNEKFLEVFPEFTESAADLNSNEIKRIRTEIDRAAGFLPEFRGIVHIELDDWVGHEYDRRFRALLEYLSDHGDEWLIVLSVTGKPEESVRKTEAVCRAYLRLERVDLHYPNDLEMIGQITRYLARFKLVLSQDAEDLLLQTVRTLRGNEYFDGMKTVRMLSKDIVYRYLSGPEEPSGEITAEDLREFSCDGEYVKRQMKIMADRHTRIGFTD